MDDPDAEERVRFRERLYAAPAGSHLLPPPGSPTARFQKRADGLWHSTLDGLVPSHMLTALRSLGYYLETPDE